MMIKTKKLENVSSLSLKDCIILYILYSSSDEHTKPLSIPSIIERFEESFNSDGKITQSYTRNFIMELLNREYVKEYRGEKAHDITYGYTKKGLEYFEESLLIIKKINASISGDANLKYYPFILSNSLDKIEFKEKFDLLFKLINNLKEDGLNINIDVNNKK